MPSQHAPSDVPGSRVELRGLMTSSRGTPTLDGGSDVGMAYPYPDDVEINTSGLPHGISIVRQVDRHGGVVSGASDRHALITDDDEADDGLNTRRTSSILANHSTNIYTENQTPGRSCPKYMYVLSIALFIISMVTLLAVGIIIIRPHHYSMRMRRTTCIVEHIGYLSHWKSCTCDGRINNRSACSSEYPSITAGVEYRDADDKKQLAIIHETEEGFTRYSQCSFKPRCTKSRSTNNHTVALYAEMWALIGSSEHTCYYDPFNRQNVSRRLMLTHSVIIHAICWPSALLLISAAMFLMTWCSRGHTCPDVCWIQTERCWWNCVFYQHYRYRQSNTVIT